MFVFYYCQCLWLSLLLTAVSTSSIPLHGSTPNLERRQNQISGEPSLTNFVNRVWHSSIVVSSVLYIDGGEITFSGDDGQVHRAPENYTFSVDMSTSWTPRNAVFNTINKTAPVWNLQTLWADRLGQRIFSFGGARSGLFHPAESPPVPAASMWELYPNGVLGSWSEVTTATNFGSIERTVGGMGASGGGAGWLLGGLIAASTDPDALNVEGAIPVPGMVSYNFTTGAWSNESSLGFSEDGTALFGQMHLVTGFGNAGILLVLGGDTPPVSRWSDDASNLTSFEKVHLYDPYTKTWYNQTTSGSIPPPRDRFCHVGVQSDIETYEIFIFGGHIATSDGTYPLASDTEEQQQANLAMDSVYVLSLPSFNWQQASYVPTWPRIGHSCNVAGRRQMVVVGGINPAASNITNLYYGLDPWDNGLGIFDLSIMQWKTTYNADALPYTSPQLVKNWYVANGRAPAQWDNPALASYFQQDVTYPTSTSNPTSTNTGSGSAQTSSSTGAPIGSNGGAGVGTKSSSSNHTGAIAGGVVGGILALVLVAAVLWFCQRRRRKTVASPQPESSAKSSDQTIAVEEPPKSPISPVTNNMSSPNSPTETRYELGADQETSHHHHQGSIPSELSADKELLQFMSKPVEAPTTVERVEMEA